MKVEAAMGCIVVRAAAVNNGFACAIDGVDGQVRAPEVQVHVARAGVRAVFESHGVAI